MSFQQGISGLNAASRSLDVIGNNIANANTVGAKVARAEFADVYANATQHQLDNAAGMGTRVAAVTQQFSQGSIRTTENPMDVAINGRGFFRVAAPGSADAAYTRNGQFQLDRQGYVVTSQGMRLQGYAIDPTTGKPGGVTADVQLPSQGIDPHVTSSGDVGLNLDARTPAPTATTPAFALGNADSYNNATSMAVYDQQGNEHVLSLYFRRTATDNQWDVYSALDGTAVPAVAAGVQSAAGRLTFGADGRLDPAQSGTLNAGVLGAGGLTLPLPFPTSTLPVPPSASTTTAPVTLSFNGSTQFGSAFGVTSVSQDGYAPGQLTGFGIDAGGMVQARYSNGRTMPAAQIALADFRNEQGLAAVGGNLWRATPASGQPAIGAPGSANVGVLQGGALEEANIDLTQQLVDMITAQRAYQANAQTIKTQDQLTSTLVNLR
ncbi:flagellar hook protein FlgE [Ramlibacter alkalitolerans]|uniref:Flagellar hook protein FlgE n=1 Tax=Ramlibacter alkalitolerans TaxID=2039631 RepID=A0ABS1JKV0_9BURK|nr:flagellar hook protein FlgE [Ramlibacter alkalitolerans]MBL0424858.1 flagellar hook protein FlgE [Ramlibacter alkalitolerans]